MTAFNVGDRVRAISGWAEGREGTVVPLGDMAWSDEYTAVRWDDDEYGPNPGNSHYAHSQDLELVETKFPGDPGWEPSEALKNSAKEAIDLGAAVLFGAKIPMRLLNQIESLTGAGVYIIGNYGTAVDEINLPETCTDGLGNCMTISDNWLGGNITGETPTFTLEDIPVDSADTGLLGPYDDPEVNPNHYKFPGGAEVRHISQWLTANSAQALQYIARSSRIDGDNKGDTVADLNKAIRFLEFEIDRLENL